MVAKKFLADVELEDDLRLECVSMCKYFHEDVIDISSRLVNFALTCHLVQLNC